MPPTVPSANRAFPGRTIKKGEPNAEIVLAIQRRLNAAGCGPIAEDGTFTDSTTLAVKRFQLRFTDVDGLPLKVDGLVGPITWAALFGAETPATTTASLLSGKAIDVAGTQVGVFEDPIGSN